MVIGKTPEELAVEKSLEDYTFAKDAVHQLNMAIAGLDAQIAEHQLQISRLEARKAEVTKRQGFIRDKMRPTIEAYETAHPPVVEGEGSPKP